MTDSRDGAGPGFDLAVEVDATRAVLRLSGELDLASAPELAEAIERLVADGQRIIELDLGALDFCDSTGVSAMLAARSRILGGGGGLTVTHAQGKPLRVLTMTGVLNLLTGDPGGVGQS
jgi:anti-sigma B factor antagonist